jgi:hypothetical protein
MNKLSSHDTVDMTRRRLMMGIAATPFLINPVWALTPKNPDVVIIGAGAAGLGEGAN